MQLARRSVLDTTLTTLPSLTLACSEDDCIFERRRKFERLGRTLTVDQDFAGSRSRSTGAGVWECSEVLSAYLRRPELCRGRRSSSARAAACAPWSRASAARRASSRPTATPAPSRTSRPCCGERPEARAPPPLKWEEATRDSAKALGAPFDVVLGADLTYNPNNAIALANALVAHAGPDSTVLLAHKRRVADDDATIAKLGEYFATETLVAPRSSPGPDGGDRRRRRLARLEASRSIFALTNQNAAPPITTDSETLFELRQGDGTVTGRLRLVDYLNPNDPLYFESRKKAVSVSDCDLAMTRVAD
ncbi:methyltransferase [Aureococcus anophagefferens]|nr:methyltransferase [Aureococcus anophagefferens]